MRKISALLLCLALAFAAPVHAQIIGNPIAPYASAAVESGHILKGTPGYLYGFSATSGASAGYVLIFNSATVPADGAVTPINCYELPANQTTGASWIGYPEPFTTGISIAFSTTGCFNKTASATAFFSAQVR